MHTFRCSICTTPDERVDIISDGTLAARINKNLVFGFSGLGDM